MRHHFHLAGGIDDPDHDGLELASLSAARRLAAVIVASILIGRHPIKWLGQEFRIEITDIDQLILYSLSVAGSTGSAAART